MIQYLFTLECPIDGLVKYIGAGKDKNVDRRITKDLSYITWINKLNKRKLKPICKIIDKATSDEIPDLLDFYRGLFISWGFNIFESFLFDKRDIEKLSLSLELERNIESSNLNLLKASSFKNNKTVLYYLNDLLNLTGVSRTIDEMMLVNIIIFIYGNYHWTLVDMSFFELERRRQLFENNYGRSFLSKFTEYVPKFIERYGIENNPIEKVFKKINLKIQSLERSISKSMKYFGYANIVDSNQKWIRLSAEFQYVYFINHWEEAPEHMQSYMAIQREYLNTKKQKNRNWILQFNLSDRIIESFSTPS